MSSTKINPIICLIIDILNKVGIWKKFEESKNREVKRKLLYILSFFPFQILLALYAFLSDDKNQSLFLTEMVIGCMVLNVKLMYLLWKKGEILHFLHDSIDSNSILESGDKLQAKKIKNFIKFVQAYLFLIATTAVVYTVSFLPFFSSEKKLPFFITISFEWEYGIIIYWVAYLFLAWGVTLCVLSNLIAAIIWYIMLNYSIQYQKLGSQFRNLGANRTYKSVRPIEKMLKLQNQNSFLRDFIGLVKSHQKLSKY